MLRCRFTVESLLVSLCLVAGCLSPWGLSQAEPPIIIIRNSTSRDFYQVMLRAPLHENQPVAFGQISPLLRQTSFVFRRPSPPKPLDSSLDVIWIDRQARSNHQVVALREVLKQATGQPGEALVFEITENRGVNVSLEQTSPHR